MSLRDNWYLRAPLPQDSDKPTDYHRGHTAFPGPSPNFPWLLLLSNLSVQFDLALAVKTAEQVSSCLATRKLKRVSLRGLGEATPPPRDKQSQVPLLSARFGAAQLRRTASSWKQQASFISFIIYAQHVGTGPLVIKAPRDRKAC